MALAAGSKLGPYQILGPLGAGGMGEVYRARDTRLGRDVAVKVLAAHLAASEASRQRFEREARAISKLSHPHICALYDVAQEGDVECLIMELLEGQTLADRLLKGPLPLEEALRFGAEIASALDAAHRKGIIHRDLKPGNVMLTPSGVKLLDFGLAKALNPDLPAPDALSAATATAHSDVTGEGAILGTLAYMPPEQLEGKRAGTGSDIFALGLLLFEMVTGRRAFVATSHASLISAILTTEPPPVSSARHGSPPALDRLVKTCLVKDPEKRWQSAHDVGLQLRALDPLARNEAGATVPPRRRPTTWLPWAITVAALAASATLIIGRSTRQRVMPATIRFAEPPPVHTRFAYAYENTFVALSPDGSQIAYAAVGPQGGSRLWTRSLESPEARVVPGGEEASSVFWSPDGRSLAFMTWPGKLKRVEVAGGTPVSICDLSRAHEGGSGTWGQGGDILFASVTGDGIYRVPSSGGTPTSVLRPATSRGEKKLQWPLFLPDGRTFLYVAQMADGTRSLLSMAPGGSPRVIMPLASNLQLVDPDYLVFAREGVLLGQRLDWRTGALIGAPVSIAEHVRYFLSTAYASFSASRNGTIAYQAEDDLLQVVRFDRTGRQLGTVGTAGKYMYISISPDSTRALFSRARADLGTYQTGELDLARGLEIPLTSSTETEVDPVWLADGKGFVHGVVRSGAPPRLFSRDLGSGAETELLRGGAFQLATDVSPDGQTLLFSERTESGARGFQLRLSKGGEPTAFSRPGEEQEQLRFSPDGRFVAFLSGEAGRWEAYVAPFPGPGERTRVSTAGATLLRWNRRGNEIVYLAPDGRLMSAAVRTGPTLTVGTPVALFTLTSSHPWRDFDVMREGQEFLALVPEVVGDELPLHVIVGWKPNAAKVP